MCKFYRHYSSFSLGFFLFILMINFSVAQQHTKRLYVSKNGNQNNPGTKEQPYSSAEFAIEKIKEMQRESSKDSYDLIFEKGIYYFDSTLLIDQLFLSDNQRLTIKSEDGSDVTFSAAKPLKLNWVKNKSGIWTSKIPSQITFQQLYADGKHLIRARYPNFDPNILPFNGYAEDAISPERVKKWKNPQGAIVHALHIGRWGGFHYRVLGKNERDELQLEGGLQNNRPSKMHETYRFVENVFEELDAENEWYLDEKWLTLFLKMDNQDPNKLNFEAPVLESLISIKGSLDKPIKNIDIEGVKFVHTAATFMQTDEPLLRSDWTIYRQGAIRIEGAENCTVTNSDFIDLGGNAIFVSNYNRSIKIAGNLIERVGAGGINFVGDPNAVRSPSFRYEEFVKEEDIDITPGPKTENYPSECEASDNLIRQIGLIEKQVAGVQISMSSKISVLHNTIYNVPRSGINVGDGTWGGHVISFNDVFKTVLETSDHGAFNSWGRDRFWHPDRKEMDRITELHPEWVKLDAIYPTVISDNRFRCDHGWDIDLDDGSSNYRIFNNLCLSGGLKLREGFYRTVSNNLMINNGFHPHVWFKDSHDVFKNNIVMHAHQDIQVKYWGDEVDYNLYTNKNDLLTDQAKGVDQNSKIIVIDFEDVGTGKFDLISGSLNGYKQVNYENVGVTSTRLKELKELPEIPVIQTNAADKAGEIFNWKGAELKSIETLGEQSAAGLPKMEGVLIMELTEPSALLKAGIQKSDVIVSCQGEEVKDLNDLKKIVKRDQYMSSLSIEYFRNQERKSVKVIM